MKLKEAVKWINGWCELDRMAFRKTILTGRNGKKIRNVLFLCNHATYFHSHRLEIARTLIKSGLKVSLFCGSKVSDESAVLAKLRAEKIEVFHKMHLSGSTDVMSILQFAMKFFLVMRRVKPDLLHCISMKSALIGLAYSRVFWNANVVIAISGLGSMFTKIDREKATDKFRNLLVIILLKSLTFNNSRIKYIVQNNDDYLFLLKRLNIPGEDIYTIPGSGVDARKFTRNTHSTKGKKVLMASRLLVNKGVIEYLGAIKNLKNKFPDWEFLLAGINDLDSPAAFEEKMLADLLAKSGCVYLGHVEDMGKLLKDISIFTLPSYREGFPKVLIEAGVAGCAIVTTDVPGCRDAILSGSLGVLIQPRSIEEVERGIALLISNLIARHDFSKAMEHHARSNLGIDAVIDKHLEIYGSFLR